MSKWGKHSRTTGRSRHSISAAMTSMEPLSERSLADMRSGIMSGPGSLSGMLACPWPDHPFLQQRVPGPSDFGSSPWEGD